MKHPIASAKISMANTGTMEKNNIEAIKFTLVGAANFVLTFIVFTTMLKILGVNYLLSLSAAWVVGMFFSYVLNFVWVFKPEQKIQFKVRFFRFFLSGLLSISLNILLLKYIVEHSRFDPFYVQTALVPFIVIFNFGTAKYWSMRRFSEGNAEIGFMKIQAKNCSAISFRSHRNVENIYRTGIQLCAFLVFFYCVWTLDRGFDISDEAYYLLLAIHSGSVKYYISAQQWLTAGLWHLTGSITLFRASGLVLLLAGSVLLARGVFSACLRCGLVADRAENKRVVLAGSIIGALLYASTINLSPCYNLLASAGAYAAAGLVLLAVNRSSIAHKYALIAIAGCAVGVEALSKPSAGVATLVLLVFWGGVFERSHRDKFFGLLAMIFGFVVFTGITLLCNTTLSDATRAVVEGMGLFRMVQVETVQMRLARYFIEFGGFFLLTLKAFALPLTLMVAYRVTYRSIYAYLGLATLVITLVCGNIDLGTVSFSVHNAPCSSFLFGGFNRYDAQAVALFSMLVMALTVSVPVWNKNWSTLVLFAGLFLLPYTVALGTGNALFSQIIDSLAPWGALVAVLVIVHPSTFIGKIPASLIGLCFAVTVSLQIATSSLRPYHLSVPLIKQDQSTVVGNLGEVKVDADTYRFLSEMRAAATECDIAPETPFIGLYNIPGVALVLQATPVLTPWLNNKIQAEFVFGRVRPEGLRSAVIAFQMERGGVLPPLPQQLAGFPLGYQYCGVVTYPYLQQRIQIWQSLQEQ